MGRSSKSDGTDDGFITAQEIAYDGSTITVRVRLPKRNQGEMLAIAEELLGASRIRAVCEDGVARIARIPGKMKRRRMWIRAGDLIIIKPWDFQPIKCDVQHRYKPNQAGHIRNANLLPEVLDIF